MSNNGGFKQPETPSEAARIIATAIRQSDEEEIDKEDLAILWDAVADVDLMIEKLTEFNQQLLPVLAAMAAHMDEETDDEG